MYARYMHVLCDYSRISCAHCVWILQIYAGTKCMLFSIWYHTYIEKSIWGAHVVHKKCNFILVQTDMLKSIFFCYTCVATKTRNIWCHLARFFPFPCDSNLTELVLLLRLVAMVHPHDSARTDGTMLFHGGDNSVDSGDKHLTHLLQAVDCCLT